jgi:hypothetical protein
MQYLLKWLAGLVSAGLCLLPTAGLAAERTAEDVRAEFERAGYQVSMTGATGEGVGILFVVDDYEAVSVTTRVLMVHVYPDAAAADVARANGPNLVPGYGPSLWFDNVALVQTSWGEIDRRQSADWDQVAPTVAPNVDDDFAAILGPSTQVDL